MSKTSKVIRKYKLMDNNEMRLKYKIKGKNVFKININWKTQRQTNTRKKVN